MNILIIGTGYVGLVTGTCLAELGHQVTCLDINANKIGSLQQGIIPFYEPGLSDLVMHNVKRGSLLFTTSYEEAVPMSDVIFLAVPTPSKDNGACDLSYFFSAAHSIATYIDHYVVIVNKSTVPVGTADQIDQLIKQDLSLREAHIEYDVVSNPEFLKEGSAIDDFMRPDRMIIGASSNRAVTIMQDLYSPLISKGFPCVLMDTLSAEMTKYAANAMLASRISFMNEISLVCQKLGANIHSIKKGLSTDRRIGPYFLNAGIGYGGSCFPKDIKALKTIASDVGVDTPLINAIEEVNNAQKKIIISMMKKHFLASGGLKDKTIALWGLAFKPNTDDMREAPSIDIILELLSEGARIQAFDPIAIENAKKAVPTHADIQWCNSEIQAAQNADAIILITEWEQFAKVDLTFVGSVMKQKSFFDGRNFFDQYAMIQEGFQYYGIGIPNYFANTHATHHAQLGTFI
jgi:UDPglucose 6-dehydrogenase